MCCYNFFLAFFRHIMIKLKTDNNYYSSGIGSLKVHYLLYSFYLPPWRIHFSCVVGLLGNDDDGDDDDGIVVETCALFFFIVLFGTIPSMDPSSVNQISAFIEVEPWFQRTTSNSFCSGFSSSWVESIAISTVGLGISSASSAACASFAAVKDSRIDRRYTS
mmetsp:Transcript_11042/g.19437  ORF Transcript_11042/g.19437 Transcript_11042/m.19437 type:complete len:162 (-) Transcript_11042:1871-2356(-)